MQQMAVLFAIFALVDAHYHAEQSETHCTCEPGAKAFESYHIHVMFYPDLSPSHTEFNSNPHASQFARDLRGSFIERFQVPECDTHVSFYNLTKLCAFPVDSTGAGFEINAAPFVVPNFAFFVPVDRYAETVPWMMANRGDLDFLVHPNTCGFTCAKQDHVLWSVWGGNKWPVRFELAAVQQAKDEEDQEEGTRLV